MRLIAAILVLAAFAPRAEAIKIERIHSAASVQGVAGGGYEDVTAECVLVQFSTGTSESMRNAAVTAVQGVGRRGTPVPDWELISLSSGARVEPALTTLAHFPGVARVTPNRVLHLNAYPSDPGVPAQYSLTNTNAFAGWEYGTGVGGAKVTVAVIDSGIDFTHPDLAGKNVNGGALNEYFSSDASCGQAGHPDCQSADNPVNTACSHGTQVASVAAASTNNGQGIAGVSWGAQLVSLRVFDAGCAGTNDFQLANAISYATSTLLTANAASIGKLVLNMSIGSTNVGATCGSLPLTEAELTTLIAKGVPIAIAAGNTNGSTENCSSGGTSGVTSPAACAGVAAASGIIPVGATDANNNVARFSCQGPELASHGVSAPGNAVLVDTTGGGTTTDSGTSFSSPFVAGLMALMLSVQPGLTPAQLESYLRGGASALGGQSLGTSSLAPSGNGLGAGQVNVFRTMRLAVNGTLADFAGDQKAIAFPNPFRVSQDRTVSFSIPTSVQGSNPEIKVYAADGVLVRTLNGLTWDGKNDAGNPVGSGTYIFLVTTGAGKTKGRVAVIR